MMVFCGSWFWLFDAVDFGRDVKAAVLPTVESATSELTEGSDVDDTEDSGRDKKKRIGFRDRKVGDSGCE